MQENYTHLCVNVEDLVEVWEWRKVVVLDGWMYDNNKLVEKKSIFIFSSSSLSLSLRIIIVPLWNFNFCCFTSLFFFSLSKVEPNLQTMWKALGLHAKKRRESEKLGFLWVFSLNKSQSPVNVYGQKKIKYIERVVSWLTFKVETKVQLKEYNLVFGYYHNHHHHQ